MTLQQYWTQPIAHTERTDLRPGLTAPEIVEHAGDQQPCVGCYAAY